MLGQPAHAARSFRRCWWAQTGHRSGCAHAEVFRKPGTPMFSSRKSIPCDPRSVRGKFVTSVLSRRWKCPHTSNAPSHHPSPPAPHRLACHPLEYPQPSQTRPLGKTSAPPTVHAIRPAAGGARACTRVKLLPMSNCCWIEPLCQHCRSDCVSNPSLHSSSASRTVCEPSITHDFYQSTRLRASPRPTAAQGRHRRSRMEPASRAAPSRCRGPSCGGDRVTRSCR